MIARKPDMAIPPTKTCAEIPLPKPGTAHGIHSATLKSSNRYEDNNPNKPPFLGLGQWVGKLSQTLKIFLT